ncbi:hypothetical protein [Sphingosinicella terrae]|uniref:hypothetical protein n=1 Tax=Sphingosinicella terrae TaxID=2172047 RepID=UPI0013B38C90|nr:hypothetical protein [Sphingosinicella terrae]
MNVRKTLKNPIMLTLQGFAAGALLFFAVHPFAGHDVPEPQPSAGSVLESIQA